MDQEQEDAVVAFALAEIQRTGGFEGMNDDEVEHKLREMTRRYAAFTDIGFPAMELEGERADRKIAIWEVLLRHVDEGMNKPPSWAELLESLSPQDLKDLDELLDGATLAEALELGT